MDDQKLLELNDQGFIPGPNETEEAFLQRIFISEAVSTDRHQLEWVFLHLKSLYGFVPGSISLFYSNQGLAPWQGAACWIDERGSSKLQLREEFLKGSYLGIYQRDEIIAHEAVHAARAAFDEPVFEEVFAYGVGSSRWRRVLGPIVQRPWEVWLVFAGLLGSFFSPLVAVGESCLLGYAFFRLARRHRQLHRAFVFLTERLKDESRARCALFRMTDCEIAELSRGKWIWGDQSLRWRLIRLAYMNEQRT